MDVTAAVETVVTRVVGVGVGLTVDGVPEGRTFEVPVFVKYTNNVNRV